MIRSSAPASGAEVAAHYDDLDFFYRDVWGEHVHHGLWRTGGETREQAVRQLAELAAAELAAPPGQRVCDIGCGYGATARLLAEEHALQVTAVTISPAQHAFAQSRRGGRDNPVYLLADWLRNDLPDASFDAAIAIESSEHMPDLTAFFRQAARVLRPGGRLVICAWLSADAPSAWQRRFLLEPICREGRMPLMGAESDYRRAAAKAGFDILRFQDVTRQVASTWPRIVRTFAGKLLRHPRYLRYLFDDHAGNRVFAGTILRVGLAYRTGAMRYGVFTGRKGCH